MEANYQQALNIPVDGVWLPAELVLPAAARGIIIFAHGSGSSRLSPRNREVARSLQENHFGTLLFDLLTVAEDEYDRNRFAIDLLKERLISATRWLEQFPPAKNTPIAFFGASTGAAAALKAAAVLTRIFAVVSRGGGPDLALHDLSLVKAPTLLIVGGNDEQVLALNQIAYNKLRCSKKLEIIADAGHLFEEPGALAKVSELAANWFKCYSPVNAGQ